MFQSFNGTVCLFVRGNIFVFGAADDSHTFSVNISEKSNVKRFIAISEEQIALTIYPNNLIIEIVFNK